MKRLLPSRKTNAVGEHGDPAELSGWTTGVRAHSSTLLRWTAWGLLALGPLLGGTAFLTRPAPVSAAGTAAPRSAVQGTGAQGAAGFATLFVGAYLRAGDGDQEALAAYYPAAKDVRLEGAGEQLHPQDLTVVRERQTAPAVWSVTVAARITPPTPTDDDQDQEHQAAGDAPDARTAAESVVRFWQVPVASSTSHSTTGYTALAMPAEVAGPPSAHAPALAYGPMRQAAPSDPRTQAVTEFLTSYLTGDGDLERYLAPGTHLKPLRPAPYTGLAVDQLALAGDQEPQQSVPANGTTVRLLAAVRATDHAGTRRPLTYALTLTSRAGRWEVASLDSAPATARATKTAH